MHIVVTGASSGIGAALARELATMPGAKLTLVARRRRLLEDVARGIAAPTHVVEHDLSNPSAATDWLEEAERVNGPVDILVNNAGVQVIGPSESIDVERGEASIAVNLLSPLRLTRAVLPAMIARRAGSIVDVTSLAALAPTPNMTYYNASKAGLAAASEAMRGELRGTGVHVLTVYPGIIDTELADAALDRYETTFALKLQPKSTPALLARAIRRAIVRKKARVVHPSIYGFMRWVPTLVRWFMDRFSPRLRDATPATQRLSAPLSAAKRSAAACDT